MAEFVHDEVLSATGAKCVEAGPSHFSGVSTDTRSVAAGQLFVALEGERFDAHALLDQAFKAGAGGAIVRAGWPRARTPANFALYEVPDTLRALGALGRFHRRRFSLPVGAVGGSNGKTTTKEMVASILSVRGPSLATEGNLNNEVGVPLTLFRLTKEHVAAVIELGMNHPGEVERLTAMAEPRAGVVTVVQPEHLEGLGSLEGVAHAEGELYRGLPKDGVAVANADDVLAHREAIESGRKLIRFGRAESADVRLLGVDAHDATGQRFRIGFGGRSLEARIQHVGEHNALNACAAFGLGIALGYSADECIEGLARAKPVNRRLNIRPGPARTTIIDDCYNANPGSMHAALETLKALAQTQHEGVRGRAIAVLGDMLELGAEESEAHRELGEQAAGTAQLMLFFGPRSRLGAEAAKKALANSNSTNIEVLHTESPEDAVDELKERLKPGDVVLIKGSRGMRMERIVAGLLGEAPPDGH
jgi:UDP-N-acetylmuramoyl-tripeptide--D-alanyl-D-alanine ligase